LAPGQGDERLLDRCPERRDGCSRDRDAALAARPPGQDLLLDSGRGRLVTVDPTDGKAEVICELPGYTRGLAMIGPLSLVGLSKIRETSTFGGVPVSERRDELKCGVAVVELGSGRQVSLLEFHSGVEEIFDVQLLHGAQNPVISGPYTGREGGQVIWLVPQPR